MRVKFSMRKTIYIISLVILISFVVYGLPFTQISKKRALEVGGNILSYYNVNEEIKEVYKAKADYLRPSEEDVKFKLWPAWFIETDSFLIVIDAKNGSVLRAGYYKNIPSSQQPALNEEQLMSRAKTIFADLVKNQKDYSFDGFEQVPLNDNTYFYRLKFDYLPKTILGQNEGGKNVFISHYVMGITPSGEFRGLGLYWGEQ